MAKRTAKPAAAAAGGVAVVEPGAGIQPPAFDPAAKLEHRLEGLDPQSLLAFLALLGLLRCWERAAPEGEAPARIRWDVGSDPEAVGPTRPVLVLPQAMDQATLLGRVVTGAADLAKSYDFDRETDINFGVERAKALLETALAEDGDRAVLFAALFSDGAYRADKAGTKLEATPYCFQFGQGHQHLLKFLRRNAQLPVPAERKEGRVRVQVTAEQAFAEALLHPWLRLDSGAEHSSFRWDPAEDVRYAYRLADPSSASTKEGTVHGANRLAALGLPALTVAPQQQGDRVRLHGLGMLRRSGVVVFRWPVWRRPAGLAAIRGLLGHPAVLRAGPLPARSDEPTDAADRAKEAERFAERMAAYEAEQRVLRSLSVAEIWEAQRMSVGKFMNVTAAAPVVFVCG